MGVYPQNHASFLAMVLGPILNVAFTTMTHGRFYAAAREQRA